MRYIRRDLHVLLSALLLSVALHLDPSSSWASIVTPAAAVEQPALAPFAPAASYSESSRTWMLSAKVLQVKEVSIYGRPGSIAKIEYTDDGKPEQAWAAVRMDDYSFSESNYPIMEGSEITLQVSGNYVSAQGVDWTACPGTDLYCQNAGFIEGGFPVSEDFGGLSTSPSNMLIYRGSVTAGDWVNGILAWKIRHNTSPRLSAE